MTWQPSTFTPDAPTTAAPAADWSPSSFVPDNPHATGQEAAQSADVKPIDTPPPPEPPKLAPSPSSSDEPSMGAPNPIPIGRATMSLPPEQQAQVPDENAQAMAVHNQTLAGITSVLGKFDPTKGVQSVWDATRLAWMDNPTDRAKYLQEQGYDAKVINAPGVGPMTVFKDKNSDTWRPVNGSDWSAGDLGRAAAATPALATQIGTTWATDGAGLPLRMAAQALTGAVEKGAEELGNKAAGNNSSGVAENAADMARAGGRSSLGELLGSTLAYVNNVAKGVNKGVFVPTNEGSGVLAAQDRLNAANPDNAISVTPGAVGAPVVALREKQISPLSVTMQNAYDKIRQNLAGMLDAKANDLTGGSVPAIGDAGARNNGVFFPGLSDVAASIKNDAAYLVQETVPTVELSQGGSALRQGANALKEGLVNRTSDKYGAIPDEGVGFNINPMKQTAKDLEKGIKAKGYPIETTTTEQPDALNGALTGAQSTTNTTYTPTTVMLGETPAGYMGNIVSKVKQMFPDMEEVEGRTPYEQLQNLRTKIGYAASEYPVGGTPQAVAEFHQARQMLGSLDNVLANPQGANAANFAAKLSAAKNAATTQNTILDNPMIQKIRNSQVPPEDLMDLASPGNFTNLQLLKRTMPPDDFSKFRDAWASSLVRNPDRIPAALKAFNSDPRSLQLLASPKRQQMLQDYAGAMDKMAGSPIVSMMAERNFANRPAIALNSNDANNIADLINRAGGPNSPIGMNLRAAALKSVVQGGQKMGKLDLSALASSADSAINNPNIQKILPPSDVQMLNDIRDVAGAQGKTAAGDMQGGLAAGHVAGAIKNPIISMLEPIKTAKGVGELLEAWLQAKMWSKPLGRHFMVGAGPGASLAQRVAGAVGANATVPNPNQEPRMQSSPAQ